MVAVTNGAHIMELITRAKIQLAVLLVGGLYYYETKLQFHQAADLGLVEMVNLGEPDQQEDKDQYNNITSRGHTLTRREHTRFQVLKPRIRLHFPI